MGSGRGQGGQSAGMAGSVPPGGIASMLGQMPPGMGGPLPQQGGMMGGQQAQGGPQMGFGQAMMGGQAPQGGMPPQQIPLPGMTQQQMQALIDRDQQRADQFNQQQGAMGGPAGLMGNRPSFVMDGQIPPGGIPSQSEMLMRAQQGTPRPGVPSPMVNPPRPQVRPRPQGGMGLASMMRGGSR
jgi:hypothetical protein